jgi:hypothetical protein
MSLQDRRQCFIVLPIQSVCRQVVQLENEATKHIYNYTITNFIPHNRHTASPLQRPTSDVLHGNIQYLMRETSGMQQETVWAKCRVTLLQQLSRCINYGVAATVIYSGLIQLHSTCKA